MTHSTATRDRLRSAFVERRLSLAAAAADLGVSLTTARRWRAAAAAAGDDWRQARAQAAQQAPIAASAAAPGELAQILAAIRRLDADGFNPVEDAVLLPNIAVATTGDLRRLQRTIRATGAGLALLIVGLGLAGALL